MGKIENDARLGITTQNDARWVIGCFLIVRLKFWFFFSKAKKRIYPVPWILCLSSVCQLQENNERLWCDLCLSQSNARLHLKSVHRSQNDSKPADCAAVRSVGEEQVSNAEVCPVSLMLSDYRHG